MGIYPERSAGVVVPWRRILTIPDLERSQARTPAIEANPLPPPSSRRAAPPSDGSRKRTWRCGGAVDGDDVLARSPSAAAGQKTSRHNPLKKPLVCLHY